MPRAFKHKPTDFELAILTVIWDRKTATVREVFEALKPSYPDLIATTVHKIMALMIDKGFLAVLPDRRPFVFSAVLRRTKVQRNLLTELVERAFSGSPLNLIMQALSSKKTSREDLAKIRKMIEKAEQEEKQKDDEK